MKYLIEVSEISLNERIRLAKKTEDIGLLMILSDDESDAVKIGVAENPITTLEILGMLSRDLEWNVRIATLNHPNTSKRIKKRLLHDENLYVRMAARNSL